MDSKGFTIIELLVVIVIVGVLAAIAIPQFRAYRVRGYDVQARSDLRTGIAAEEAYYIDAEEYASCSGAVACEAVLPGLKTSKNSAGVGALTTYEFTGDPATFVGESRHESGSKTLQFDKNVGVVQEF